MQTAFKVVALLLLASVPSPHGVVIGRGGKAAAAAVDAKGVMKLDASTEQRGGGDPAGLLEMPSSTSTETSITETETETETTTRTHTSTTTTTSTTTLVTSTTTTTTTTVGNWKALVAFRDGLTPQCRIQFGTGDQISVNAKIYNDTAYFSLATPQDGYCLTNMSFLWTHAPECEDPLHNWAFYPFTWSCAIGQLVWMGDREMLGAPGDIELSAFKSNGTENGTNNGSSNGSNATSFLSFGGGYGCLRSPRACDFSISGNDTADILGSCSGVEEGVSRSFVELPVEIVEWLELQGVC